MSAGLINEELQKIDVVRERTGLSFTDARSLLESVNWDVMEALITADRSAQKRIWEVRGMEVVDRVRQLVRKGNATNIRIKTNDRDHRASCHCRRVGDSAGAKTGAACRCCVSFDQVFGRV